MTPTDLRDRPLSRRCALLGLGGVGAAAVLAACSSGSSDTAAGASDAVSGSTSAPSTSGSSAAAPSAAASSPAAGGAAGIASLSDIPVGGTTEVQVDGGNVLLSQPTAGTVEAFSAVCPHQGGQVKPDGSAFKCSLHQSEFSIDGAVTKGPAQQDLEKIAVTVSGDAVVKA